MNRIESRVLIAVITTLGTVTTYIVKDVNKSIQELNSNVATVIERTIAHEKRIESIEKQVYHKKE